LTESCYAAHTCALKLTIPILKRNKHSNQVTANVTFKKCAFPIQHSHEVNKDTNYYGTLF